MQYTVYEKSSFNRLGNEIEDITNIFDSKSVNNIITFLKKKRGLDVSKRTIYRAIKTQSLINDKFSVIRERE